jgi:glutathione peroxidase-family protein
MYYCAGEPVNFSSMRDQKKAYIVVNVACQCGLTEDHYAQFNELYAKYASEGLEIIAFPCKNTDSFAICLISKIDSVPHALTL